MPSKPVPRGELKLFYFRYPDNDFVLLEFSLKEFSVGGPPVPVQIFGHDFHYDDVVMLNLASRFGCALNRRPHEAGNTTETCAQLLSYRFEHRACERSTFIIMQRQQDFDEPHGSYPGRLANLVEYSVASTGGMLCSHIRHASSVTMYSRRQRGSVPINQGPWEKLESAERKLAKSTTVTTVYSITGPLYEAEMPRLPKAHLNHVVPSGYWKVVAVETDEGVRTVGFIMHQDTPRAGNYCNYVVTIGAVEFRSHLKFFPDLPAEKREALGFESLAPALGCP